MRGAWIEIIERLKLATAKRRSLCEERGLKSTSIIPPVETDGRFPCGECGLKSTSIIPPVETDGRFPCGECGLKYNVIQRIIGRTIVAPLRGAWIEMHSSSVAAKPTASLPMRGAWIKIRGSCQATITVNVSGWQMVHLWCYSLSDCDWRKGCGSIFKKTR